MSERTRFWLILAISYVVMMALELGGFGFHPGGPQ